MLLSAKDAEIALALELDGEANIFADRQFGKDAGDLKRARDAATTAFRGRCRREVLAVEQNPACRWRDFPGNEIEQRRFPGSVRADDRAEFAWLHAHGDVADGLQRAKGTAEVARVQNAASRFSLEQAACDPDDSSGIG